ncbi:MAG: DUF115 domain-containing protein [Sporomusaceae bacterium]|jgi:hypothetical protein|nr:DUF115 domain-containing protein [Sporomusaceae bacterium]
MDFTVKNEEYLQKMAIVFQGQEKNLGVLDDANYEKKYGQYFARRKDTACFLSSRYSEEEEIKSMFALTPKDTEYIILFGAASLAAVRYALDERNFPDLLILTVVEPSPAWFGLLKKEVDFASIIGENASKVAFFVGYRPASLGKIIGSGMAVVAEKFSLVQHLSVRSLFPEYYNEVSISVVEYLRAMPVFLNTGKTLLQRAIYNEFLNLALPAYNFEDLMPIFKNKTVIIVSAGPSLEKNICLLEEAKQKAVVVAVGSAIRILDERGITPHFVVALDPQPSMHKIFGKLKNKKIPIIHLSVFYYEGLKHYEGTLIRACASDKLNIFLQHERGLEAKIFPAGPSVGNLAAEIFCAAGIKKLIFTGQDMCMYGYQLHADTGEYDRFKKMHQSDSKNKKDLLELKDIYGNDVISPRNYYMIKDFLEDTVNRYNQKIEFINATEGGLGIKGTPNKTLCSVLASLPADDIEPVLREQLEKMEKRDFCADLYQLKAEVDAIEILNNENLTRMEKIKEIFYEDTGLSGQEKYAKAFKDTVKNEHKMKEIKFHRFVQENLEVFLETDCLKWGQGIESPDLHVKFRAILEIQLKTAQTTKLFLEIIKQALSEVFADEIKVKTFSLVVKA